MVIISSSKKTWIIIVIAIYSFNLHAQKEELNQQLEIYKSNSQFDSALLILNKLLILTEVEKNDSARANIYLDTGYILCRLHRCNQGKDYFIKAYRIGNANFNSALIAKSSMSLGNYFLFEGKYDSSHHYYQIAMNYFNRIEDSKEALSVRSNVAYLYFLQGEVAKAKIEYEKIIQFHLYSNDSARISMEYFNLALTYQSLNLFEDALNQLLTSQKYSKDNFQNAKTNRELAKVYLSLKEYKKSSEYFLAYDSLIDDHVNRDYSSELSELAEKFKTAEIERDNALKQAEIESNQQQLTVLYATLVAFFLISLSIYVYINQRRKRLKVEALRNQEIANQKIQDLLQTQEIKTTYALLEGQDKERKRIAIELHDNLGSILTSLNMFSDALQSRIDPKEIKNIANRINETSTLANEEIRKISHSLDSGLLKHFGLKAAIKQLIEAVESAKKISFDLELQIGDDITNEKGLEVYRIIQELVNNALKHAKCDKIHLEVNQIDSHLSIIFEDNGVGFNQKSITPGMGLKNIKNRSERLDGEFSMESTPGKGSTFIIELPNI